MQCSTGCGNPAASDCRKAQCGRCCVGCLRHPRKLPPPGEPGSCECGQTASPNCEDLLCGRWHDSTDSEESDGGYYVSSTPAQQTMCTCGQTASPQCDYFLCASCCHRCTRHYVPEAKEESEAGPQPGQPGSCECGQTASPLCDLLCASCCHGCSRHGVPEAEEESEAGPQPGQPGSCECGQTASALCDYFLCASCCHGCSRHFVPETAEEEQESEADYYQPPPQQQQHVWWGGNCGQQASPSCAVGRCRNCCSAAPASAACCSYHSNRLLPARPQYDSDTDSLDYGQLAPAQTAAQQHQRQRCACGQFAAATCSVLRCASCCHDVTCSRHGVSRPEASSFDADLAWLVMRTSFAEARPNALPNTLATYGLQNLVLSVFGSGTELDSRAGQAQPQPPAATRAAATAAFHARGSFAASHDTGRAAGQPDQQQGPAAAGPSSSSSDSSVAKTDMPASEAEEALFQLKHCVVCLDETRSVLLLPCKHLVLCAGCMVEMQQHARNAYRWGQSDDRDIKCPMCCETAVNMLPGIILS